MLNRREWSLPSTCCRHYCSYSPNISSVPFPEISLMIFPFQIPQKIVLSSSWRMILRIRYMFIMRYLDMVSVHVPAEKKEILNSSIQIFAMNCTSWNVKLKKKKKKKHTGRNHIPELICWRWIWTYLSYFFDIRRDTGEVELKGC